MLVLPLEICLDVAHEVNAAATVRSEKSRNVSLFIENTPQRKVMISIISGGGS
jgi:hypothetical protein